MPRCRQDCRPTRQRHDSVQRSRDANRVSREEELASCVVECHSRAYAIPYPPFDVSRSLDIRLRFNEILSTFRHLGERTNRLAAIRSDRHREAAIRRSRSSRAARKRTRRRGLAFALRASWPRGATMHGKIAPVLFASRLGIARIRETGNHVRREAGSGRSRENTSHLLSLWMPDSRRGSSD